MVLDLWLSGRERRGGKGLKGEVGERLRKAEGQSQNWAIHLTCQISSSCTLKMNGSFLERSESQLVWGLTSVSFCNQSNCHLIFIHPLVRRGKERKAQRRGRETCISTNSLPPFRVSNM